MASVYTYRDTGLQTGVAIKAPVKVATTANITLSGTQTIDGVAVVAGDRVLARAQSSAAENGIYVVATTTWARAKDFDGPRDVVQGTRIPVAQGTTYAGQDFVVTNSGTITVGTTELTFKNQAIFSDVYQGAQASDPATRSDGSALQDGDLYLNTASGILKVYASSAWANTVVSASSFAATLLDDTTAAAARTTLGALGSDISALTAATVATGDLVAIADINDSNNPKKVTAQSIADLNSGATQTASTYTPTVTCGTSGTITLNTSLDTLNYAQTGDLVQVWGRLTVSSVSSPTGRIHLTLPVAPSAGTEGSNTGAVVCWMSGMVSANVSDVVAILSAANSRIEIYLGDGAAVQSDSAQQVQSSTDIYINATYMAS